MPTVDGWQDANSTRPFPEEVYLLQGGTSQTWKAQRVKKLLQRHYLSTDSAGCLLGVEGSRSLERVVKKGRVLTSELLMRLSLFTQHSTEGRPLWSLNALPKSKGMCLSSRKGRESQNTDNFVFTTTTSPAVPASIHQLSSPPCPSLTVPLLNFQILARPSFKRA